MIRIFGKGTVSTWRPFEAGGGAQMRASGRESNSVTILDQMVIVQQLDGFWETFPLCNCAVTWSGKPTVTYVTEDAGENVLTLEGRDHTIADEIAAHHVGVHGVG